MTKEIDAAAERTGTDFDIAIERLTAWVRDYGDAKPKEFIGDVSILLLAAREARRERAARLAQEREDKRSAHDCVWLASIGFEGGPGSMKMIVGEDWECDHSTSLWIMWSVSQGFSYGSNFQQSPLPWRNNATRGDVRLLIECLKGTL